jgi:hypothetical protein
MSVEIQWDTLDEIMAERVRDFLNDKLQTLPLPPMLKSIKILSFEFGSNAPTIEIQHITDPYPEFYQENYDEDDDDSNRASGRREEDHAGGGGQGSINSDPPDYTSQPYDDDILRPAEGVQTSDQFRQGASSSYVDTWTPPFFPQGTTRRPGNVFPSLFPTPGIRTSGISTPTWIPGHNHHNLHAHSWATSAVDAESVCPVEASANR